MTLLAGDDRGIRDDGHPCAFSINRVFGSVVVGVTGAVDDDRALRLRYVLTDLVDGQGNLRLVIDLRDTTALAPEAVEALSELGDHLLRRGGDLVLSAPSPGVLEDLGRVATHAGVTVTRN